MAIWLTALFILPQSEAKDARNAALATPIERQSVKSSSINSIGYSAAEQVLEIEFRTGAIYRYLAVPPVAFDALMKANSKGRHFAQYIRNRFEFLRVEAGRP